MNAQVGDFFDEFWAAYPRRVGKGDARKVWSRLRPSRALLDAMLKAIAWQVHSPQWAKDGGQFIPYPATWLRQERWEDEPIQALDTRHRGRGAEACDAFDRAGDALERLYEKRSGRSPAPEGRAQIAGRPPTGKT